MTTVFLSLLISASLNPYAQVNNLNIAEDTTFSLIEHTEPVKPLNSIIKANPLVSHFNHHDLTTTYTRMLKLLVANWAIEMYQVIWFQKFNKKVSLLPPFIQWSSFFS